MKPGTNHEYVITWRDKAVYDNFNHVHLSLSDFGYIIGGRDWHLNVTDPPYSRLYYMIGGDGYVIADGERIPLKAGRCYLLPAGYSFSFACENYVEKVYFHLHFNDDNGLDYFGTAGRVMEYTPDDGLIGRLKDDVQSPALADTLRMRCEVMTSLLTLAKLYGIEFVRPDFSRPVLLAMDYIRSHLGIGLGTAEIAANAFVAPSTLNKKFRTEAGITIGGYIERAVMQEAENLLLGSRLSIQEISQRLGFCDQSYFARRFKRCIGSTPKTYRRVRKEG